MTRDPHHDDTARNAAIRRVLIITLVLNLAVAAAKGVFGLVTGSLAIATDGVHSLVDASANVVAMVAMRAAAAPPDDEHPYGHRKFEIAAAMFIGVFISVAAFEFAWSAIDSLISGRESPATSAAGFVVLIGTWVVNMFVTVYERRRGHALESHFLLADAAHTGSDVMVTAGVLGSYAASYAGIGWADPLGALLVVVVIAVVAWRIVGANLSVLVDRAVIDADEVRAIALSIGGVEDCHRVRSRGTSQATSVDLHILVDADLPLREAHDLAHRVEDALRERFEAIVDVTVHVEPDDDEHEEL